MGRGGAGTAGSTGGIISSRSASGADATRFSSLGPWSKNHASVNGSAALSRLGARAFEAGAAGAPIRVTDVAMQHRMQRMQAQARAGIVTSATSRQPAKRTSAPWAPGQVRGAGAGTSQTKGRVQHSTRVAGSHSAAAVARLIQPDSATAAASSNATAPSSHSGTPSARPSRLARPSAARQSSAGAARAVLRGRVLICAPSNAAVDEIVERLVGYSRQGADGQGLRDRRKHGGGGGVLGSDGRHHRPIVVRLGAPSAVKPSVLPYTLDALASESNAQSSSDRAGRGDAELDRLRGRVRQLRAQLNEIDRQMQQAASDEKMQRAVLRAQAMGRGAQSKGSRGGTINTGGAAASARLRQRRAAAGRELSTVLQELSKDGAATSHALRQARLQVLASAHVVATTLTGASAADGREVIAASGSRGRVILPPYDAVIIDEAGQSGELGALIPIVTACMASGGGRRTPPAVVLVGDPRQLPATVLSRRAERAGFGSSLLERVVRRVQMERRRAADSTELRGPADRPASSSSSSASSSGAGAGSGTTGSKEDHGLDHG